MKLVRVVNRTRGEVLAERAELADDFWTRFMGLMGRRELPTGGGLVLQPGGGIHMWFMRIPLDVLHVDKRDRVTHVLRGIRDRRPRRGTGIERGREADWPAYHRHRVRSR